MGNYDAFTEVAKDSFGRKGRRVLLSFSLSFVAAIVVLLILQLVQFAFYRLFNYEVFFNLPASDYLFDSSHVWNKTKIIIVYGIPPLVLLITGLFAVSIIQSLKGVFNHFKLFMIWIGFYTLAIFSSFLFFSTIGLQNYQQPFYFGYSVVGAWLHIPELLMLVVTIAGLVFSLITGFFLHDDIIRYSYSSTVASHQSARIKWILEVVLVPLLLTTAVLAFIQTNTISVMQVVIFFSCSIFIVLGMIIKTQFHNLGVRVKKGDVLSKSIILPVILMFTTLATVFLVFYF